MVSVVIVASGVCYSFFASQGADGDIDLIVPYFFLLSSTPKPRSEGLFSAGVYVIGIRLIPRGVP
ncbi:MAG: hypothetical protein D6741_04545 [Planctomycetota bacterium]|nr:MAG: hypothetical protein D6741_04545 [Planctomycetota bacterium]